jgi:membrane-associated HD superfamily phosphohydrolase
LGAYDSIYRRLWDKVLPRYRCLIGPASVRFAGMKRLFLIPVSCVAAVLLTGCGDSTTSTGDTGSAGSSAPTATETAAAEVKEATSNAADEVAKEVKKQAGEVAAEIQEQARLVYEDLSAKLIESTKSTANDLMKDISSDLETRVKSLGESLKTNEDLMTQLNDALGSLLNNEDIDAVEAFNSLTAAKLTPEQSTLAKDVYNAGAAFVTQRNFNALEGMDSDVAKLSTSVWKGNYTEALQPLQNIWNNATLTNDQKDLLGSVFDNYLPGWRDKAEVVNQGLDALKKFGQ